MMHLDDSNPAWCLLTEQEKLALNLKFVHQKSTWEVGEILERSHYKYLELVARAETYLRMFTLHFNLYETLIPEQLNLDPDFKEYLELTILKRLSVKQATLQMGNNAYRILAHRDRMVIKHLDALLNSPSAICQNIVQMIKDFDRWNNFRILPAEIQEPSAFKRRNKNRLKKQIKTFASLSPFHLEMMRKRFEMPPLYHKATKVVFCPMVYDKRSPHLMVMRDNPEYIAFFTQFCFYIFRKESEAQDYLSLITQFFTRPSNNAKWGLHFWPQYRVLISYAVNYAEIQKVIPSRRNLENGLKDIDIRLLPEDVRKKYSRKRML